MLAASSSCTDDTVTHNTASVSSAALTLLLPGSAADIPSDAPATPVSHALVLTGSHSAPGMKKLKKRSQK